MNTQPPSTDRARVEWRTRVFVAGFALCGTAAPLCAQSFADVRTSVAAGDYRAARELALSLADPLERARALVWVDYGARDYDGAWREAGGGLASAPRDPWLAERRAAAALAGRSGVRAAEAVEELAALVRELPADDPTRADLEANVETYRGLADALVRTATAGAAARDRARWTALGLLAGAVLLVGWALRAPRQRISSRPEPSRE
ncbi:MAG: hypothetical protein L6Q99_07605 [Planctomycetes bacterium]|nr:hypothetical protein [Planctomycetota bacterium]